jgi:hypothetical protein
MSDGKQNSGFNSSLEAKAPVVVLGLLFGKMAVSDISLHQKKKRCQWQYTTKTITLSN